MKQLLLLFSILTLLVSCSGTGTSITKTRKTKKTFSGPKGEPFTEEEVITTKVELPANNKEASTVKLDEDTTASMGASYPPEKRDRVAEKQTTISTYAAIGLGLLAIGLFVGHRYFPLIPTQAPVGIGALAGALYMAPTIMDRYSGQIAIAGGCWLAWTIYSGSHNFKLKKEPAA